MVETIGIPWEDRLPGLYAGALVTMYYDVTPDMASLEDGLTSIQQILYLLAVVVGLFQLPLTVSDLRLKQWKQGSLRALVSFGPVIIFLGAEGLLSHYLWWSPLSDTDRFHMLHHSLVAGAPLTLGYGLVVRRWRRLAANSSAPAISRRAWLAGGIGIAILLQAIGVLVGGLSLTTFGPSIAISTVGLLVIWRLGR